MSGESGPEGRDAAHRRIGVVDIGSNSIRLVVYDGLTRAPLPIVNRKATIGLGTDVERQGRLGDAVFEAGVAAVDALVRIADDVPVADLRLLATAAVRDARNGDDFCAAIEAACGRKVTVVSGDEEARLSALGVISAAPDATGIVGDLGGGSLELVAIDQGRELERISLPIGPLRLIERTGGKLDAAARHIDEVLAEVAWLDAWRGRDFFAVGGAWRAVARLYIAQYEYPLHVVHGFHLSASEARGFTRMLEQLGRQTISLIRTVSRKRAETLPWGAIVLDRVIAAVRPADVIFSAHGLREGFHFCELDEATRLQDPLLAACRDMAGQHRRFADAADALDRWLGPVVALLPEVPPRLVIACCVLADIAWHEHPEYRAEQAMLRTLRMPCSVLTHEERGFLGLALYVRYGGSASDAAVETCRRLLGEERARHAKAIGKALRLAFELCAGRGNALTATPLTLRGRNLALSLQAGAAVAAPDRVERYAASLGRAVGCEVSVLAAPAAEAKKKAAG